MTLQQQYNLIKEGKGDKAHFLKNAKFQFPNLFNAFTSYEDSVNVLKGKGLIAESTNGAGGVVTGGREQDWVKIFKQNISEEVKAEEKKTSKEVEDILAHNFDYKDDKNIDNVYGQAFLHGFYTEMQDPKNEAKTVDEVKEIVRKNLASNRLHYTEDGMFGVKGVGYTTEAPGLGTPKEPKGKYKSSGYGDLREGIHDRRITDAPHTNIDPNRALGDYNPAQRAASLKRLMSIGRGIEINGREVEKATQNGDTSFTVTYKDGDTDVVFVNQDGWDELYAKYGNVKEGWEENQPLEKGKKQTFVDKGVRTSYDDVKKNLEKTTARYGDKLKAAIRELILQELDLVVTKKEQVPTSVPSNYTRVVVDPNATKK
jgi:hypothetical protein